MKTIAHFFLITFSFAIQAQSLTPEQIDSIVLKSKDGVLGNMEGIAEGILTAEKTQNTETGQKITKGNGGFSYVTHFYLPDETEYHKLAENQKKRFDFDKHSRLIKATYHSAIQYDDDTSEDIYADFYYNETGLFYIKVVEKYVNGTSQTENSQQFDLSKKADLMRQVNFTDNLQTWIAAHNQEILKYAGKDFPDKK